MAIKTISFVNNKGGIGKSTICCSLAHAIGNKGHRVLLIDHDSQGNSSALMLGDSVVPNKTIFDIYSHQTPITQCLYPTQYENVTVLPNTTRTASLEPDMYSDVRQSYHLLRDVIEPIKDNYEYILIDAPPNLGMWVIMALIASDAAIIPLVASSRFSLEGFIAAFDAIEAVSERFNPSLKFLRAVINRVDLRTSISKISVEMIRANFGSKVFENTIPHTTQIEQAEQHRQTVLRFAPQSGASKRFRSLADELITTVATNE